MGFINELNRLNTPNNILNLIRSYFSDRKVIYQDNKNCIKSKSTSKGCPQESCSGPIILWNLVKTVKKRIKIQAYADHILLIISGTSLEQIEVLGHEAVNTIVRWCAEQKLSININKTNSITIPKESTLFKV